MSFGAQVFQNTKLTSIFLVCNVTEYCCFFSLSISRNFSKIYSERHGTGLYTMTGKRCLTHTHTHTYARQCYLWCCHYRQLHEVNIRIFPRMLYAVKLLSKLIKCLMLSVSFLPFVKTTQISVCTWKSSSDGTWSTNAPSQMFSLLDAGQSFARLRERGFPEELGIILKRTFNSCQRRSVTCHTYMCTFACTGGIPLALSRRNSTTVTMLRD